MKRPPGWPFKKVKSDVFSPTLFADTCQTLDGPTQVFAWFSQVLGGYTLDLKLSVYMGVKKRAPAANARHYLSYRSN